MRNQVLKLTLVFMSALLILFSVIRVSSTSALAACPSDMVHYWTLDEPASPYTDFYGGDDAGCTNCPTSATGIVNGAQQFDASSKVEVADDNTFDWGPTDSFSIELWMKTAPTSTCAGTQVLVGRNDSSGGNNLQSWLACVAGGKAAFYLQDKSGMHVGYLEGTKILTTGGWHHVVAVRDGAAGTISLYVDGQLEDSQNSANTPGGFASTEPLTLGWLDLTSGFHFVGALDELALYNRILSENEIRSHYYLARGYCELCVPVAIMPLGDSITAGWDGTNQYYGYRRKLYRDLSAAGYSIEFVGSLQDGPPTPDFDIDHEGHGGYMAEGPNGYGEVVKEIYNWLVANPADVVLLHIGTNDVAVNGQSAVEIGDILDEIYRYSKNITVVLALIINEKPPISAVTDYNTAVLAMAQNRIANGDKIIIVDQEHALTPSDMADWLHPTQTGYDKMAGVWFNGLVGFFPQCSPLTSVRVWLEAESGSRVAPMVVESDGAASSGQYVWVPNGSGNLLNPLQAGGSVSYTFNVPVAGNYVVWGRVIANSIEDDSFYVSVDNGAYALWDTASGGTETWIWDRVNNRDGADPVVYSLGAGQHALVIKQREDGTKIDRILVTNDSAYFPQGQGEAVPLAPVITSTPVTSAVVAELYTYDVIATGSPAPIYSLIGTPPTGMTINGSTGLIQWTPTVMGTFDVTVEAANASGVATQSFAVTVTEVSSVRVWLEAESGSGVAPMVVGSDGAASSGQYVWVPNGSGNLLNPLQAGGSVSYTFNVPVAGNYVVWGRVIANSIEDDSFYVSVDNGAYALWDTASGGTETWIWDRVNNRDGADPVVYSLGAGQHALVIKQREDGTKIDRILVTNDSAYFPQGQGEAVPLAPVITSTPVTSAVVAELYTYDVIATGSPAPIYSLIGTPPTGMTINGSTGLIQWTPTVMGTFDVTVEAANASGVATQSFTVTVVSLVRVWLEAESGSGVAPMVVGSDGAASSGQYVWVPNGSGNLLNPLQAGGSVSYTFNVPVAGNYVVWGRVIANSIEDDSFYVSVDNGAYALWDTASGGTETWIWDRVNNRDGADPVVYSLGAGQHALVIKQREDGTKLDRILITNDMGYVPQGLGELVWVWLEAESGSGVAPMVVGSDGAASSGHYVWVPNGSGNLLNPLQAGGSVSYTFNVPVAGNYVVWGRVIANSIEDDSFYVSVDNGAYALWDTASGGTETWIWDRVNNRDGADPVVYSLGAGQHALVIKQREDGTKLDRILITNDMGYVPQGQGE